MKTARELRIHPNEYHASQAVLHLPPVTRIETGQFAAPGLSPLQKTGYALLFLALMFAGFQAVWCGIASAAKLEALVHQLTAVEAAHNQAQTTQIILKDKISLYGSPEGIEEMARERLGLVGQDEILVRLYPASVANQ